MKNNEANPSFVERGGLWVLAQIPILLLAALLPLWNGHGQFVPRYPLQGVGVILTCLGVAVATAGLRDLGRTLTPFPYPLKDATLRRGGLYAYIRHPIYSGLLCSVFGWAVWWISPLGLAYTILVAAFFDRKAAREEAWLEMKYQEQYVAYKKQVKKFLPWIY